VHEREKASAESLVTELDDLVPRDGACVTLRQYGGGPDESRITANQRGYLRLGIEFLKAAFAPTNKENSLKADIGYLLTEDSDVGFDWGAPRGLTAATEARPTQAYYRICFCTRMSGVRRGFGCRWFDRRSQMAALRPNRAVELIATRRTTLFFMTRTSSLRAPLALGGGSSLLSR